MAGNTNPNQLSGVDNLQAHFTSLTQIAIDYITSLISSGGSALLSTSTVDLAAAVTNQVLLTLAVGKDAVLSQLIFVAQGNFDLSAGNLVLTDSGGTGTLTIPVTDLTLTVIGDFVIIDASGFSKILKGNLIANTSGIVGTVGTVKIYTFGILINE